MVETRSTAREDAGSPPLGIEISAVALNGAESAQIPLPDGDLFEPEDDEMDMVNLCV